jgi:NAD(P)-dependent dehydrogenase (short-subunit alcohol dehydrogenase family)
VSVVVVITGATRGIGLGLARELLARQARVVICGRSQESVDKALATLGAGDRAVGRPADVADRDDLQALWDHAVEQFGQVDHWVNNAGISVTRGPLTALPPADIDAIVRTNLCGVLHGSAVAGAGMAGQPDGGQIWNMEGFGSGGQLQVGMTAYGATKRAVSYATDSLAKGSAAAAKAGQPAGRVRYAHLSPGIVKTELLVDDYEGQPEAFEKAKRIFNILGDEVATVTPFLAEGILAAPKNGSRVAWLTTPKASARFFGAFVLRRKRDLFAD